MRRKDREITDYQTMLEVLAACSCIRLGLADENGAYIVPVNFGMAEENGKLTLYFHGAKEGHKVDAMNRCDKVCLTVWNQGFRKDGHWEWNPTSVVVFGKVKPVTEKNIFEDRLRKLAAKYYPTTDEIEKEMERSAARAQLFAIKIEHMTGKLVNEK